nr:hypothetical protein [Planctomycetota bacterium]
GEGSCSGEWNLLWGGKLLWGLNLLWGGKLLWGLKLLWGGKLLWGVEVGSCSGREYVGANLL